MKRWLCALVLGLLLATGVVVHAREASASGPVTVKVTLRDYAVAVSRGQLPAGRQVKFVITNRGSQKHELVLEPSNAVDRAIKFRGTTYEADDIKPGTTRTVVWTVPHTGTFKLACHIDHHYQKGMKTLIRAAMS